MAGYHYTGCAAVDLILISFSVACWDWFGRCPNSRADLRPALGLVLTDDALMPVHLALDPVLKYATRLGELSNDLVATLSFNISTKTGRKVQGLPNGKFMCSHVPLQQVGCRRLRQYPTPLNTIRFGG